MQQSTASASATIKAAIERIAAALDPLFPSLHMAPPPDGIEDGSRYYGEGKRKPDFVEEDDRGWGGK